MIKNIVLRGFGNGTVTADKPATRGYSIGASVLGLFSTGRKRRTMAYNRPAVMSYTRRN